MKINGSWKTTLFGTGGLLTVVAINVGLLLDGNPNTNPEWHLVLPVVFALIGNLFSKDFNVSNAPHPTEKAHSVE